MTEQRVIVDALNIDYPTARVVNNLSFTLGNERLALVGESGSGKSMSARALMGLVRKPGIVSASQLNVLGNDLLTLNNKRWQALRGNRIAMVLQDPRYALNPVKNVAAQLEEALTLHQSLPRAGASGAHPRHYSRRRANRQCADALSRRAFGRYGAARDDCHRAD